MNKRKNHSKKQTNKNPKNNQEQKELPKEGSENQKDNSSKGNFWQQTADLLFKINCRDNDDELSDLSLSIEALKHSKNYSKILKVYVRSLGSNVTIKNILKVLFFIVTMGSMLLVVYLFYDSIQKAFEIFEKHDETNDISIETILSVLTVIVPTISSLIVAFIKIPEIIAEYLFNRQEEEYMNSIIKNIQDYDRAMFAMEHKVDDLLKNQKGQSNDIEIEVVPQEQIDSNVG